MPIAAQTRAGLMGDLMQDVTDVETKIVGLAKALPAAAYDWRPGTRASARSARSSRTWPRTTTSCPAAMGIAPPAETGITKDFKTAAAFEKRSMTRDQVIAELSKSFAFLKTSMNGVTDAQMNAPLEVFGQKMTNRGLWVTTATHLHEHLGQLIAYARSNKVTPPWSK